MPDHSYLDNRYFVDDRVYNCPFCNRRHVAYWIYRVVDFDWADSKRCTGYFVQCGSCSRRSMHLTFENMSATYLTHHNGEPTYKFALTKEQNSTDYLDQCFFFSVPTSFFSMDGRIPKKLRELLVEAEGCYKSNFLTGASACARKIIYELGVLGGAKGDNYEDRIKSLKEIHPEVEPSFFDTLLTIQQVTSNKVHENSYDGWDSKHLRIILASLSEVLHEIFVVPALRADRRKAILDLKGELIGKESTKDPIQ